MAGSSTKSWWDHSKWTSNIGRNSRITYFQSGAELAMARLFVKGFWDPVLQTGTRPWLDNKFRRAAGDSTYICNVDTEQPNVIAKLVTVVGRDLKKVPLTDAEALAVVALIGQTNNRRYGTEPYFGGTCGAVVTVP